MPTSVNLATHLGGAIGSDFVQSRNQIYFVEFDGKVSVVDLVRQLDVVVHTGTATMPADSSLDLVNGTSARGGHIRWDHVSSIFRRVMRLRARYRRVMRPQGNCVLAYVGAADFDSISHAELQNLSYSQTSLSGQAPSNQLTPGMVFAVFNNAPQPAANFDCAKVQVLSNSGGSITIKWATYRLRQRYRVLGTGYTNPEDIQVTAGGRYAYVTERTGNLLRVDLTNANRSAAAVVASDMTAPHQIVLDESHGQAYVGEFSNGATGKLWRVDLSSGTKTAMYSGLHRCTGLLMSNDLAAAYVAEQEGGAGCVARINLASGTREVLATGLTAPFFMRWGDEAHSSILLPERDPANSIKRLDLTSSPVGVAVVLHRVASRPSSLVMVAPGKMAVCSSKEINVYDLTRNAFLPTGPLFMGIGLVPLDHIINTGNNATDGYADTTDNPGYLIQVQDAPFGGSLAIMVNHNAALLAGALYYKVFVNQVTPTTNPPVEPRQSFSDYLWNAGTSTFDPTVTSPDSGGFYPVRLPVQIWYNPLLGYVLDSSVLANGLCVIDIKLYDAAKVEIPVASFHSRRVKIDNQWPMANIDKIFHDGVEVPVCQIVDSGSDEFTFQITASDPQGHLLSWRLTAMWGDNRSASVASDSYSSHVSPTRQWPGVASGVVPASAWHATVAGDPTSTRCAHTFHLGIWDRTINGYGYLHHADYHKSITIWL